MPLEFQRMLCFISNKTYKLLHYMLISTTGEQEKELPADHPYLFSVGVHTQVTQRTNSRNRQKTIKLSNQNCETLGLFILLSSEC